MKRQTKVITLFLCAALLLLLSACGGKTADGGEKLRVIATFDALSEFAREIGGDKIELSTIIPDGTEPHDFEPKARDIVKLGGGDVFIQNGLGFESWAEESVSAAGNEALITVTASDGGDVITVDGRTDPHIWLSLKGAQNAAENITEAFCSADPDNAEYYKANCAEFIAAADGLLAEFTDKFADLPKKSFVTGHAAFGYLCREFGLEQQSVEDIFAEGEPSAKQLAELVELCREKGVTTVFSEETASPEVSRTLADEVGADVVPIFTMETSEDGTTYLRRMRANLTAIYESLTK